MEDRRDALRQKRIISIAVLWVLALVSSLFIGLATEILAAEPATYTVDTYQNWLKQYGDAKPDFKSGDTLTPGDIPRMRPFVPPGYIEQLNFPGFKARIVEAVPHTPASSYLQCTEKYASQVRLRADGAILNYTCGQPFPNEGLTSGDTMSGYKAAWNYTYRYLYFGFYDLSVDTGLIRLGYNFSGGATNFVGAAPPPAHYVEGLPNWKTSFPTEAEVKKTMAEPGALSAISRCFMPGCHSATWPILMVNRSQYQAPTKSNRKT